MSDLKMGSAEARFADMIWENEPLSSGQLSKLAETEFGWKKTTSFTVLKRLCNRGIFQNLGGTVSSLISRDDFYANHSKQYVEEAFGGSLPAFLTAFSSGRKLSDSEIQELKEIIDRMRKE